MRENLGFTFSQIGWVMVCFGLGSVLGTWLSGKLSDKIGFYKVMTFSLFGSGLVFILLQFVSSFEGFCLAVFLLTSIADMYRPAMLISLDTYAGKESRTQAFALVRSAVNLGFLFGPVLGGVIIVTMGYSYIFYIDAISCILSVLLFVSFVKEKKLPFKLKKIKPLYQDGENPVFDDKLFLTHLVVTIITGILFFQIFTTLPLYYKDIFNLTEFECGLFLSLNGLIILLFELPIVTYVIKNNVNRLAMVSYGILSMSISYLMLLFYNNVIMLVLMMIFMTIGVMFTFPFANDFVKNRSHKNLEGRFMAFFTLSYSISHIVSSKLGMEIIQKYGYNANWMFLSIFGFVGFLIAFRLVFVAKNEAIYKKKIITESLFK
jgi:predicted MFS family arabinose efflux permease